LPVYRLHRKEKKNETALKLRFKKTDARINNGVSGAHNTIRSDAENSIVPTARGGLWPWHVVFF
jgi:hypothetical protein